MNLRLAATIPMAISIGLGCLIMANIISIEVSHSVLLSCGISVGASVMAFLGLCRLMKEI